MIDQLRLADHEITPGLRALRQHETERGLDRWPRGCMRRAIDPSIAQHELP